MDAKAALALALVFGGEPAPTPAPATPTIVQTTPGVVATQPFRGVQYHAGHSCPTCGYDHYPETYVKVGNGPVPGTHTHTCPRDGTVWYH